MYKQVKKKDIPSEIYDRNYLMSQYLEGLESFKKGLLSVVKTNELNMLELKKGTKLLEVGIGRGELLCHCAKKGADVTGIDYSKDSVDIAKETMREFPSADLQIADCRNLPFISESFERVFAGDVIEHMSFEDGIKMLQEMYRVLKPGGFMLIHTTPNTIFTKIIFPFGKHFLKLINKDVVNKIDYNIKIISPKYHIYEYNLLSLKKAAKEAGLIKNIKIWISEDILRSGQHRYTKDLGKNPIIKIMSYLGKISTIRFLFGNDLYLKCYKTDHKA